MDNRFYLTRPDSRNEYEQWFFVTDAGVEYILHDHVFVTATGAQDIRKTEKINVGDFMGNEHNPAAKRKLQAILDARSARRRDRPDRAP
jgi:hypothetical protein